MIAALPLSVSAAGEYVPGNPRWSGYQNQVQWGRPAGAASGDSFEYEAQLLLGDDVVESKAVEIDTYLFFTNDVVTRPQEEYTIRVRARWIMIVGDHRSRQGARGRKRKIARRHGYDGGQRAVQLGRARRAGPAVRPSVCLPCNPWRNVLFCSTDVRGDGNDPARRRGEGQWKRSWWQNI